LTSNAKVLRAECHTQVGEAVQQNAGLLIERWRQRAIAEQPNAARVHHEALLDHLASYLWELGRSLAEPQHSENGPHRRSANDHGKQRWQVGWSLAELIRDYQILRLVLLESLEELLGRPLKLHETQAVGLAIDESIGASVGEYVSYRDEQFQHLETSLRDQATALKEADRRKNEFLATLAHELRNPLAPLRNALEILRLDGNDETRIQQVHAIMDRQVQQMSRLVDDLLDVSRIAQGKLMLRKERLDLRTIISQAMQMSAPSLEARKHRLHVAQPANPLWVEVDRARLVQVLVNLLNNAAKYTPDGGRIELSAERRDLKQVVRVRDNGIGIAAPMLARIFDLFTQLDMGPGRAEGGLGVGLTLVRRLVELHGGAIEAHSDGLGRGSEFVVTVPAAEGDVASDDPRTNESAPVAGRHILIVEDNDDGRESLAILLRLLGHRVDVAADGPAGLQAVLSLRPEIAFIDIGLPGMDGCEVATRARAALGKQVFLVALTGHSQPEDKQRSLDAGFQAHLAKPVELEPLQHLLANLAPRYI